MSHLHCLSPSDWPNPGVRNRSVVCGQPESVFVLVLVLLNNLDSDLKSDFDFENSSDCSCSSDNTEAETEEDSDVVDDVSWSSIPVSTMQSLDFTRKSAMNITLHIRATFDDRHFEHSCAGDKSESCTTWLHLDWTLP